MKQSAKTSFVIAATVAVNFCAACETLSDPASTTTPKSSSNAADATKAADAANADAAKMAKSIVNRVRLYPRAGFASRMVGGQIQGSNESATGGFVTLATLKKAPKEGVWTQILLKNTKRYRFVRYFAPSNSFANVAELQFFNGQTRIEGTPYGTFGSRENSGNVFNKAFDGDVKSFFDAAAPNSQYLGIEIKSGETSSTPDAPVVIGNGLRSFHVGNSLTDGMGEYVLQLALAAGYKDAWMDRQTIPGAPLWMNYQSDGGFGTSYKIAFEKFAPITDLVMQTFIANGDSEDSEFSLKFYEAARVKSPNIRPWIYGQWDVTGTGGNTGGSSSWEERNRALMRIYMVHALNYNAGTKGRKTAVIPGGLGLMNLKKAFDAKKVPGNPNFFLFNYNDDLHLTEAGRQFIGMVIYSTLYDKSPVGLPIVKIGDNAPKLTDAQNKIYQQVAWDTVQSFKKDRGASLAFAVPGEVDALSFIRSEFPIRHSRLGNIGENTSFLHLLNAPKAGKYDFKVSAITDNADMKLDVFVNNQAAGSVTLNQNKDKPVADSTSMPIELKAGLNLLRILVPVNRKYDLNSIKISEVGKPLTNTMPMFDFSVWDEEVKTGEKSFVREFRVNDLETPAAQLKLTASSSNTALVPNAGIKLESGEFKDQWGGVYGRRITVTPVSGQKGEALITVTATDTAGAKRQQSFKLRVK